MKHTFNNSKMSIVSCSKRGCKEEDAIVQSSIRIRMGHLSTPMIIIVAAYFSFLIIIADVAARAMCHIPMIPTHPHARLNM